ncbi:MAG: hypothetical protein SF029_16685 [bacterium]|nr:hypothetical protein [bacterium]
MLRTDGPNQEDPFPHTFAGNYQGLFVCSNNQGVPCGNGRIPRLILTFTRNSPPTAPVLVAPENNDQPFEYTRLNALFDWNPSTDADGDPITYRFETSNNPNGPWQGVDVGTATQYTVPSGLPTESNVYWRVVAVANGQETPSEVRLARTPTAYCSALNPAELPIVECMAVQKLYRANQQTWQGTTWNFDLDTNGLPEDDVCDFTGVDCNFVGGQQHLTGLNLANRGLSGASLPQELTLVPYFNDLLVPDNPNLQSVFPFVYGLPCLQRLNASRTNFNGASLLAPVADPDLNLGNLRHLRVLEANRITTNGGNTTYLTGTLPQELPPPTQTCDPATPTLQLPGCPVPVYPYQPGRMSLCVLKISGHQPPNPNFNPNPSPGLTGPIPAWIGSANLYQLDLSDNSLTGTIPYSLGNLWNMGPNSQRSNDWELRLENNMLSGNIPDSIVNLTRLRYQSFDLRYNNLFETTPLVNTFLLNRVGVPPSANPNAIALPWTNYQNSPPLDFRVLGIDSSTGQAYFAFTPIGYDQNLDNDVNNGIDITGLYQIQFGETWDFRDFMTCPSGAQPENSGTFSRGYNLSGVQPLPTRYLICQINNYNPNKAYFFRMRSITPPHRYGQGNRLESTWVEASTLLKPGYNASVVNNVPLTFEWTDIQGEIYYTLRVWNGASNEIVHAILRDDQYCNNDDHICRYTPVQYSDIDPLTNGRYTWSVTPWREFLGGYASVGMAGCIQQGGYAAFDPSTCTPFTVAAPGLVTMSPVTETNLPSPTIKWTISTEAANATHFRVAITRGDAASATLSSIVYGLDQQLFAKNQYCRETACSLPLPIGLPNGTYTAWVQSVSAGGVSTGGLYGNGYAHSPTFTMANGLVLPARPTGLQVDFNQRQGLPVVQWNDQAAATHYHVVVIRLPFTNPLIVLANETLSRSEACAQGVCTARPTFLPLMENGVTYGFYVRAENALGSSVGGRYDNGYAHLEQAYLSPPAPSVVSDGFFPQRGAVMTNGLVEYRWNTVANAVGYEIWVGTAQGMYHTKAFWAEDVCAPHPGTCAYTPDVYTIGNARAYTLPATSTLIYWNVRAGGSGGWGPWVYMPNNALTNGLSFTVTTPQTAVTPNLIAPTDGAIIANTNLPTVSWSHNPANDGYILEGAVGNAPGLELQWGEVTRESASSICNAGVCSITAASVVPHGVYWWRVTPLSAGQVGTTSESRRFIMVSYNLQPFTIQGTEPTVTRTAGWTLMNDSTADQSSYLLSSGEQETLSIVIEGRGLDVVYLGVPGGGSFTIEVDGVVMQTVNTDTPSLRYSQLASVHGLGEGRHTVRIIAQWGGQVALDAILIDGVILETPATATPTLPPTVEIPTATPEATPVVVPTLPPTVEPTPEPTATPLPTEPLPETTPGT